MKFKSFLKTVYVLKFLIVSLSITACGKKETDIDAMPRSYYLEATPPPNKDQIVWRVLDVSDQVSQADANLLQFGSGETMLIDAGQTSKLITPQLQALGIRHIHKILISHPHKDHYNGIISLVESGISVGAVHLNMPPKHICDKELGWGCDMADLANVQAYLGQQNIALLSSNAGDIYLDHEFFKLEAVYAHDGVTPAVGETDINDLSVILALSVGKTRALFTGDLNHKLGTFLAAKGHENLKAQLLKVPHHGTESAAPDDFFAWVAPEAAFVPAPASLWLSDRSLRIRNWFSDKKIPTFVTGQSGTVTVTMTYNESYMIEPSIPAKSEQNN